MGGKCCVLSFAKKKNLEREALCFLRYKTKIILNSYFKFLSNLDMPSKTK